MDQLSVPKTYKIYINGSFIRSESGRTRELRDSSNRLIANIPLSSRKDFRNAVVSARTALAKWASSSAYLRGQILYRIAEMLDARRAEFEKILHKCGLKNPSQDVADSIEELIHYAGWSDKFQAIFSSVNPVASPHFNFSAYEPVGIVAILTPGVTGLRDLLRMSLPVITGGNTALLIVPNENATVALSFAEVLHHSDLPPGVVAVLSGDIKELLETVAGHMDVNAISACGLTPEQSKILEALAAENVKRVHHYPKAPAPSPYAILHFQEVKTTWHPVEISFAGGLTY